MLLDFYGMTELGDRIMDAIEQTLVKGIKTPDLGGRASTTEVGDAIVDHVLNG
jgi:tartrate dehydrogenase/decarboxylase/D-malate dehydrogenase